MFTRNSNTSTETMIYYDLPRRQQVWKRNQENTNYIGFFSDEQKPQFWSAGAQFILLRICRSSKYIKLIHVFGLAHVKIGVWIKAGPQSLFPAEPIRIKSGRFELIQTPYFTFGSAHVKYGVWTRPKWTKCIFFAIANSLKTAHACK